MKNFKVRNVIFCEDIREEKSNKHILIGVFGGDLHVAEFPAFIRLAIFTEIEIKGDIPPKVYLKISGPSEGMALMEAEPRVNSEADNLQSIVISTPSFAIQAEAEGVIKVEVGFEEGRLQRIGSKKLILKKGLSSPSQS